MKSLARARDRDEILRRLHAVRPDSARRWGRMTAPQMVCHLADAFRMATGEQPVTSRGVPLPRAFVKWFALYVPLRWPEGILTSPEIDQALGGTKPGDFAQDVARVETQIEIVIGEARALGRQAHPVFGRMSGADWLRWAYVHTDHHLRQFGV